MLTTNTCVVTPLRDKLFEICECNTLEKPKAGPGQVEKTSQNVDSSEFCM